MKPSHGQRVSSDSPGAAYSRNKRWIMMWVAFALAVRIAAILVTESYLVGDQWSPQTGYEMGRIARNISEGHGLSLRGGTFIRPVTPTPTAWFGPVYPYFLAIFFSLFGPFTSTALFWAQAANSAISALTILPMCAIAARLFGDRVSRFAAPVWALWPHAVIQATYLWHSNLQTLLLCLLLWLTITLPDRRNWFNRSALIGMIAALACLTDGVAVGAIAVMLLWILVQSGHPVRRRIASVMTMGTVIVVCLVPWTMRNYHAVGRFVPLRSSLGLNLFIGNNSEADGGYHWPAPIIDRYITEQERDFLQTADEYEFSQFLGAKAKTWIAHNPGKFVQLCAYRVVTFWLPELADPKPASARWLLRMGTAAPLLALAVVGLIMTLRRHHQASLIGLWMILYPIVYYITLAGMPRYRFPTFPLQILLALAALSALANRITSWHRASAK